MKNRTLILSLLLALVTAALLLGCGAKDYKGSIITNVAPRVSWAAIGVPETFSQNPNLRWFSTDADGQVIDYYYTVLLTTTVDSLGGANAVADNPPSDLVWTVIHEDSATIQLYASPDTSVYLQQYVFLRAMDDDSAFSEVIYRTLARNNHAPTCYLIVPWKDIVAPDGRRGPGEPIDPQWCLPETTATWKGVRVAWVGKDSIDVKGIQPDFEWDVRLYGPFADSASCDTLPEHGFLRLIDNNTGSTWVKAKQYYFTNMRSGWYMVYARNRDDAFVPAVPAIDFLRIYEPTWVTPDEPTKPILVANHNYYWTRGTFIPPGYDGELLGVYRDSVEQFYRDLLSAAGITPDQYDWIDYTVGETENSVQKADLYNHRLVIVLDTDWTHPLKNVSPVFQEDPYSLYLNVGGMIWVIGRKSFEGSVVGRNDFGTPNHPFALNFFNLSATFAENLSNPQQAEFAGATSLMSGFPDLTISSERVMQTSNPRNTYNRALRGVGYLLRLPESETIYKFQAIGPDTSAFHNFPVATRYNRGTWKASYFCFPLYFVNTTEAVEATRVMLDWFFDGTL